MVQEVQLRRRLGLRELQLDKVLRLRVQLEQLSRRCCLVSIFQLLSSRGRYESSLPGRLSLREFGVLIYPVDSKEYLANTSAQLSTA